MSFIEYNDWGTIGNIAVFGPLFVAILYYALGFVLRHVFGIRGNPLHDPRPMRTWSIFAAILAGLGLGGSLMWGDILIPIGTLLLLFFLYFVNRDFL